MTTSKHTSRNHDTVKVLASPGGGSFFFDDQTAINVGDCAYVPENGRIVMEGEGSELAEDPRVREAYLGGRRANFIPQSTASLR